MGWAASGIAVAIVTSRAITPALSPAPSTPQMPAATIADSADEPASSDPAALRQFTLPKPKSIDATAAAAPAPQVRTTLPPPDRLQGSIGVGYVQNADWATELRASGSFAGFHVDLHSLITTGPAHTIFDQGTMSVTSPSSRWTVDAGDLFSPLAGVGRGARVSWTASRDRHPSLSISMPHAPFEVRPTLITYRDRWSVGAHTRLEGEIASDGSHLLAAQTTIGRFSVDASDRRRLTPRSRDLNVGGSVELWHRARAHAALTQSWRGGERSRWQIAGLQLPIGRFDVGIEHTLTSDDGVHSSASAVTGSGLVGGTHLFHRQQWGTVDVDANDVVLVQDMQQSQSMATYAAGPRLRFTLQLASQWTSSGQMTTWEELQTSWQPRRGTAVTVTTAMPRITARDRLRVRLSQRLPWRLDAEVEYGRIAPYQVGTPWTDRPRTRVMLACRFDLATPPARPAVRGVVVDHRGRPVAGALVRLGPYAMSTGADGRYAFRNVPPGDVDLSVDERGLPADYASDDRRVRVNPASKDRRDVVLHVAPLATITGRVFVDRDGNGRYDAGEEIAGAVVTLGDDRATVTDGDGLYGFYNLRAGDYIVRIELASIDPDAEAAMVEQRVSLAADHPMTGLDFRVTIRPRPIVWSDGR
ncbi:MAG TPA: carboxypeptidase regulatory-like domain-containing protein [Vicinamibacterales bacterium]|nr:carboxypeptidase regulatory-like domain-containing protein [Vicinamibacterales bacterium]